MNLTIYGIRDALKDGYTPEDVLAWCERRIAEAATRENWAQGPDRWFHMPRDLVMEENRRALAARRLRREAVA